MSDRTAGINVTVPQELFGRLLSEARARDQALSAYASARFVAVMHGEADATVTSTRELDLARQLRETTAKLAKSRNDEGAERQRVAALTKRVNDLVEKLGNAPAPAPDPTEIERLRKALAAEQAEVAAQIRLVDDMARERDVWRLRCGERATTIGERDARIAELEAAARTQPALPAASIEVEQIIAAPAELSAITVRTIRQFASLGHKADWIARQTGVEVVAVRAVLSTRQAAAHRR